MVAYDLDGIFIPDLDYENLYLKYSQKDIISFRISMFPIFIPRGEYYIITGRPEAELSTTREWLERYFTQADAPVKLFHDNTDWKRSSVYKATVLNSNKDIKIYYESDKMQVKYINQLLNDKFSCEVIWWNDAILRFI